MHLDLGAPSFDIAFHSRCDVFAAGTVEGRALFYTYNDEMDLTLSRAQHFNRGAVHRIAFDSDKYLAVAISRGIYTVIEAETGSEIFCQTAESGETPTALCWLGNQVLASGDEVGVIRIWDARQSAPCIATWNECDDQVHQLSIDRAGETVFVAAGDHLAVFDLRKAGGSKLLAMSDELEDDINCFDFVRQGTKIVSGHQTGPLGVWSVGDYGDMKERILGIDTEVEAIRTIQDKLCLVGAGDGKLYALSVFPHKVLGVLGHHTYQDEDSEEIELGGIDNIEMDRLGRVVATASAESERIHFFNPMKAIEMWKAAEAGEQIGENPMPGRTDFFDDL